jgi:hypothetical protein
MNSIFEILEGPDEPVITEAHPDAQSLSGDIHHVLPFYS